MNILSIDEFFQAPVPLAAAPMIAVGRTLLQRDLKAGLVAAGGKLAGARYDATMLAGRMKDLYEQLIAEKNALRNSAR